MVASLFQLGTLHEIGTNLDRQRVLDGPTDTRQLALGRKVAGDDGEVWWWHHVMTMPYSKVLHCTVVCNGDPLYSGLTKVLVRMCWYTGGGYKSPSYKLVFNTHRCMYSHFFEPVSGLYVLIVVDTIKYGRW